ncbi:MAG: ABC transporter ATP-binding protein [Candidatus Bathyarchaeota archaeon]|nr:ABC transporter ATP-binding protein [Candidatus Bathyarchaeota archaeon]
MSDKRNAKDTVLEIKNLKVNFHTYRGEVKALNGVDLKLCCKEVLALVGESGCGKSVTVQTLIGLLPENASVLEGEIILDGDNLINKTKEEMRILRTHDLAIVFQDPMTFLNPVLTIGTQLEEVVTMDKDLLVEAIAIEKPKQKLDFTDLIKMDDSATEPKNLKISRRETKRIAKRLCAAILSLVKLPDQERILKQYPFELSGGMRQRAMIAMALARRPSIFIADEITTALDVTIQAQILHLLKELRDKIDASTLMITHDLSVAAETADRIAVMYGGNVVEVASSVVLFRRPFHPYAQMLLKAIPNIENPTSRLEAIPGTVPEMIDPPPGCRFHPRCKYAMDACTKKRPRLKEVEKGHEVACYLY